MWRYYKRSIPPNLDFGKWASKLNHLDYYYNNLATKLINMANEIGPDRYNRHFCVEELVDFAIAAEITDKSMDYIYRHYCYWIISKRQPIDVEREEIQYIMNEFVLL